MRHCLEIGDGPQSRVSGPYRLYIGAVRALLPCGRNNNDTCSTNNRQPPDGLFSLKPVGSVDVAPMSRVPRTSQRVSAHGDVPKSRPRLIVSQYMAILLLRPASHRPPPLRAIASSRVRIPTGRALFSRQQISAMGPTRPANHRSLR
jgi:hypothetical protein